MTTNIQQSRFDIEFLNHCLDYKKIGLNDVHVGCEDGKTKDIHDFITFEQIMIKDY